MAEEDTEAIADEEDKGDEYDGRPDVRGTAGEEEVEVVRPMPPLKDVLKATAAAAQLCGEPFVSELEALRAVTTMCLAWEEARREGGWRHAQFLSQGVM